MGKVPKARHDGVVGPSGAESRLKACRELTGWEVDLRDPVNVLGEKIDSRGSCRVPAVDCKDGQIARYPNFVHVTAKDCSGCNFRYRL